MPVSSTYLFRFLPCIPVGAASCGLLLSLATWPGVLDTHARARTYTQHTASAFRNLSCQLMQVPMRTSHGSNHLLRNELSSNGRTRQPSPAARHPPPSSTASDAADASRTPGNHTHNQVNGAQSSQVRCGAGRRKPRSIMELVSEPLPPTPFNLYSQAISAAGWRAADEAR